MKSGFLILVLFVGVVAKAQTQMPYERMKALFDKATPMQLNQFMLANDPDIKNWDCAGAYPYTTENQVSPMGVVPVRVTGKVVSPARPGREAIPAVPARMSPKGPLFPEIPGTPAQPAVPAVPEQVSYVDMVYTAPNHGIVKHSPEEFGHMIASQQLKVTFSPEFTQTFYELRGFNRIKSTYRTLDGLIVIHQEEVQGRALRKDYYPYLYCYRLN